jgi:hypothetical protein
VRVEVEQVETLRFDDGSPVTAASGVTRLGDGLLVVQDDGTHGAWLVDGSTRPVRVLPPVEGLDTFAEHAGTKHLKPDLEAACVVPLPDGPGVLLLGSGSSPARMRGVVLRPGRVVEPLVADLRAAYEVVAQALGASLDVLNLEGAYVEGDVLRWFQRGLPAEGVPSGSVDLDLGQVLEAFRGSAVAPSVLGVRHYDLGDVDGVPLAVTDAVRLPDGSTLVSAVAEDSATTYDDGPVAGAAVLVLDGDVVRSRALLPRVDGAVAKVEGLHLVGPDRLLAVVDLDQADTPSRALRLRFSGPDAP